jgi:hypothetical protein
VRLHARYAGLQRRLLVRLDAVKLSLDVRQHLLLELSEEQAHLCPVH